MQNSTDSKGIWGSLDNSPEFSDDPNLWERLKEEVDFASSKPQRVERIVEQKLESSREGEYYIIKNPDAGTYLKLSDRDFYIWSLMDGSRSVKDLVIEYFTKYNSFAFARIGSLVNQLKDNYFLTDQPFNTFGNLEKELDKGTFRSRSDRLWQSFLNKDFSLHNIDRFISIIYKTFGWILFTAPVKYLCLLF